MLLATDGLTTQWHMIPRAHVNGLIIAGDAWFSCNAANGRLRQRCNLRFAFFKLSQRVNLIAILDVTGVICCGNLRFRYITLVAKFCY